VNRPDQVRVLFQRALECGGPERAALLERTCAGDQSLLAEIQSLLKAHDGAPRSIEEPVFHLRQLARDAGPTAIDPAHEFLAGTQVGAYRLVRLLGSGGMGVVWLGARADGLYERQVAVKLVRHLGPAEWVKRFRTEQRALAALDHPYIAKLLDAGTTETGLPYFVMEYVEGQRIDHFCERLNTSVTDRLLLFRQVCEAVDYAHHNLIVHRDIKPSNILVDSAGVPKLLDFGIAKLMDETGSIPADRTQTVARSFTPEYASPEQILGEPVTTATDVYSLGVVLYELLTGQRFRLNAPESTTRLRLMIAEEPTRPSRIVQRWVSELRTRCRLQCDPTTGGATKGDGSAAPQGADSDTLSALLWAERLQRTLSGDVDMIVLKAMRTEPERRYSSVEQFSEDIRRHLVDLPIIARTDTWRYRTRKFARRNRALVVTVLVGALGLLGTTIGTSIGLVQAKRSHLEAETQAERYRNEALKARQVTSFLQGMITSTDPFTGTPSSVTVRQMLDEAAAKVNAELGQYPEIESELHVTLGTTYQTLGLLEEAEAELRRALDLRRRASNGDDLGVADLLVQLATVRSKGNGSAPVVHLMEEALEIRRRLLGLEHIDVAIAEADLAMASQTVGNLKVAEGLYRQALPVLERQLGPDHPRVAQCIMNLAGVLSETGDYNSAAELLRRATTMHESLAELDPSSAISTFVHLSHTMRDQGDFDGAEAVCRRAIEMAKTHLGEQHPVVAEQLRNLAYLRYEQGFIDEALGLYRESLNMLRVYYDENTVAVAECVRGVAGMLWAKGDYARAEEGFHQYLAMERGRTPLEESPRIAVGYNSLGVVLRDAGRFDEAEAYLQRALELNLKLFGEGRRFVAYSFINLARLFFLRGDYDVAEDYCTQALHVRAQQVGEDHHELAEGRLVLGMILTARNELAAAEPLLRDAVSARLRVYDERHWLVAEAHSALGECLLKSGRTAEAESLLLISLRTLDEILETGHILRRLTLKRLHELAVTSDDTASAATFRRLFEEAQLAAIAPAESEFVGDRND